MLERKFSSIFRAEMNEVMGNTGKIHLIMDAPKSGKKPYDAYAIWRGWHLSIEFKVAKGASVSYNCVTDNQKDCLLFDEQCGGLSYIIVYMARLKKCLIISVDAWEKLFDEGKDKSIKVELVERMCITLPIFYPEDRPIILERAKWFKTKNKKGQPTVATRWFFPLWFKFMDPSCKRYDNAL
jgi:penicillin-binding protein-related factor A (putative recombinase)